MRWVTAFLDAPAQSAAPSDEFWAGVTASTLSARRGPNAECATLLPQDGDAYLRVQMLGTGPPRVHLDLHVDAVAVEAARARRLGATHVGDGDAYVVLASPSGFVFCLVPDEGEWIRPAPVGAPGTRSLVDQLCLDIAPADFERETEFWTDLTGWILATGSAPEFAVLGRAPGMPLRLLLQRRHEGAGPTRAHLDLACDDREAEEVRHQGLGAVLAGRRELWTVLRDPAGREYCLTSRDPGTGLLIADS